jgi:hypothetical protein
MQISRQAQSLLPINAPYFLLLYAWFSFRQINNFVLNLKFDPLSFRPTSLASGAGSPFVDVDGQWMDSEACREVSGF